MTESPNTPADRAGPGDASSSERPSGPLRDVVVPTLLAIAVMLAVWWYWREAVVDVGTKAVQESPASGTRTGR
jgi:hypothetical protein